MFSRTDQDHPIGCILFPFISALEKWEQKHTELNHLHLSIFIFPSNLRHSLLKKNILHIPLFERPLQTQLHFVYHVRLCIWR